MAKTLLKLLLIILTCIISCNPVNEPVSSEDFYMSEINKSKVQFVKNILKAYKSDQIPHGADDKGEIRFCDSQGLVWTEGFFPGLCWQFYAYTEEVMFKKAAEYFQSKFEQHKSSTTYHELGVIFNNSFGRSYRLTNNEEHKQVLIEAAESLLQRYNPIVNSFPAWNLKDNWQARRGWKFPVSIDNLIGLELLFEVSRITNDPKYYEAAKKHAFTTLKNHFRDDYSSYHVVDYDPGTGEVRSKETAQGYAHESAWARGQAWALYGFTMCYSYTKDQRFLSVAEQIANFILSHPNLPKDKIPYWDFNAPRIPDELRDASSAAIIASALLELESYSNYNFFHAGFEILNNLSSKKYKVDPGKTNHFILRHSVGNLPRKRDVDISVIYADYYYVEGLLRLKERVSEKSEYRYILTNR